MFTGLIAKMVSGLNWSAVGVPILTVTSGDRSGSMGLPAYPNPDEEYSTVTFAAVIEGKNIFIRATTLLNAVLFAVPRVGHGVVVQMQPLLVHVIFPNAEPGITSP